MAEPTQVQLAADLNEKQVKEWPIGTILKATLIKHDEGKLVNSIFVVKEHDPVLLEDLKVKVNRTEDGGAAADAVPGYQIGVEHYWILDMTRSNTSDTDDTSTDAPAPHPPARAPSKRSSRAPSQTGKSAPKAPAGKSSGKSASGLTEDDIPKLMVMTKQYVKEDFDKLHAEIAANGKRVEKSLADFRASMGTSDLAPASARSDGLRDTAAIPDNVFAPSHVQIKSGGGHHQYLRSPIAEDPNTSLNSRMKAKEGCFKLVDQLTIPCECDELDRLFSPPHLLMGTRDEVDARLKNLRFDFNNMRSSLEPMIRTAMESKSKDNTAGGKNKAAQAHTTSAEMKRFFGVAIEHKVRVYVDYLTLVHRAGWYPQDTQQWRPVLLAAVDLLAAYATEVMGLTAGGQQVMKNNETQRRLIQFNVVELLAPKS